MRTTRRPARPLLLALAFLAAPAFAHEPAGNVPHGVGCDVSFLGPLTVTLDPGPPRELFISGSVVNTAPGPRRVSINVRYNLKVNGQPGPGGTIRFGPANLPPTPPDGFPFTLIIRVPNTAPYGTYNLLIELEDKTDAPFLICATYQTQVVCGPGCDLFMGSPVGEAGTPREAAVEVVPPQVKGAPLPPGAAWEAAAVTEGLFAPAHPSADAATTASIAVAVAPNPFAGRTTLSFSIASATEARLAVYDLLGREVALLVNGYVGAGLHAATFDGRGLASGTYVWRLVAGGAVQTGRMTLTR
jgi:hypothetical protein